MATTKKAAILFDQLYENAGETVKTIQAPLIKRSLQRKYASSYDDLSRQLDDNKMALLQAKENLSTFDPGMVASSIELAGRIKSSQEAIKADYLEMFGEELIVS